MPLHENAIHTPVSPPPPASWAPLTMTTRALADGGHAPAPYVTQTMELQSVPSGPSSSA